MLARKVENPRSREVVHDDGLGPAMPSLIASNGSRYVSNIKSIIPGLVKIAGRQIEIVVDFRINATSKARESVRP
jgi:hypothetical protein